MNPANILIVEDEASQRKLLADFLKNEGHKVISAPNGTEALNLVKNQHVEIILLDYKMPDMTGLDVLKEVRKINPEIDVVIITAFGTIDAAVTAIKEGARDYLTKPVDLNTLLLMIDRLTERRGFLNENKILRQRLEEKIVTSDRIIYKSPVIAELINLVGRVAKSMISVLILGESGTGKELFARMIHTMSDRCNKPFIAINCAAIPDTLLESELFGHAKGAFTNAVQKRIGRIEQADGGTLFLDEVGELSPGVQAKFLRLLQEKEFQRLGENKTLAVDVRVISATNQEIEEAIDNGGFRRDLLYRLNAVTINIPPLRQRREDISILIDHFLKKFSAENNKQISMISNEARDFLLKYDYPGNVRELENIMERAVIITRGQAITMEDIPFGDIALDKTVTDKKDRTLKESIDALEVEIISNALSKTDNNQTKAAEIIGISERMLRYKIKKYGLK